MKGLWIEAHIQNDKHIPRCSGIPSVHQMAALLPPMCTALSLNPVCAQLQCLGSSQYLFMCKTVGGKPRQSSQVPPPHFSSQLNLRERIQSFLKSQEHLLRQLLGTSSQICILKLTAAPDACSTSRNWGIWSLGITSQKWDRDKETYPGKHWQVILVLRCALYLQTQRNPVPRVNVPLSSTWCTLISSQYSDTIQVLWESFLYLLPWITPNIHTCIVHVCLHAHTQRERQTASTGEKSRDQIKTTSIRPRLFT